MSDRLYVGTRKGFFALERASGNGAWKVARAAFLGDNVTLAVPVGSGETILAALHHGHFGVKLHRSDDGGAKWRECEVPSYPEPPAGTEDVDSFGKKIPWNTELIWSIAQGKDGTLWCGTVPGGLFRSDDDGKSWHMIRSLWDRPERKKWFGGGLDYPGLHSICIDPHDDKRMTVGVSCGGVWMTEDSGETWKSRASGMWAAYMPPEQKHDQDIQDPHCIVQCASNPNVFWSQHHNGVFKSDDYCETWHDVNAVEPSTFGFAVAVDPNNAETAWLIPGIKDEKRIPVDGKLVVARTRDGGASFDVLRNGLPQEHAYDIVFRHALDVDMSGKTLAFGSTTGALFATDDQGDSWTALSHHLPPIHSVRFG